MKLGVAIEETWDFFNEIFEDLAQHYEVELFQRSKVRSPIFRERLARRMFGRDIREFLHRSDVVFFEWASELLVEATNLPKQCGIVTRLHRYELYRWADLVDWDKVDVVILVSEAKRSEFCARFPQQISKAVVIPEAVSLERFRVTSRPFAGDIGIMCHLRPRKRVYDLILTFSELLEEGLDLHLHIAGGEASGFGEYAVAVHSLVQRLGLMSRVTFYGHVTKPEEWYRDIDILVSNSYSEGLQVTLIEAIASGCYCLSHRWEGAEDLFLEDDLFFTGCEFKNKIRAFGSATEDGQQEKRLAQRTAVYERCNVETAKYQIREVIDAVAAKSVVGANNL